MLNWKLWLGVVVYDRVLSMGQIELNCVLMLKWIAWNRNVLTFNWNVLTFNGVEVKKTMLKLNWISKNLIWR